MNTSSAITITLLCLLIALSFPVFAEPPVHDGKIALFGTMHAHSVLSKDVSDPSTNALPLVAYQYAFDHGLDFLGISDHHKALRPPGPFQERLRISPDDYSDKLVGAAKSFNNSHPNQFVAIAGIEWGNIKTGNHLNIFGSGTLPPDSIGPREYDDLLAWANLNAAFVQLNHPNSWQRTAKSKRDNEVGDYGLALFNKESEWVQAVDDIVKTISIITTVRGGHISGKHAESEELTHREMDWENIIGSS